MMKFTIFLFVALADAEPGLNDVLQDYGHTLQNKKERYTFSKIIMKS